MKIIYLLIIVAVISGCGDKSEISSLDLEKNIGPDEVIDNLIMLATTGNQIEWQMSAGHTQRFIEEKKMIAFDVFMETLNLEDKNFYRSDSAFVYDIQDEFIGMGNVEIITPNGTLKTEKIIWNRKSDRIHAPLRVYIKRQDHEMWGANLITNSNLDFINMEKVSGSGVIDDKMLID